MTEEIFQRYCEAAFEHSSGGVVPIRSSKVETASPDFESFRSYGLACKSGRGYNRPWLIWGRDERPMLHTYLTFYDALHGLEAVYRFEEISETNTSEVLGLEILL